MKHLIPFDIEKAKQPGVKVVDKIGCQYFYVGEIKHYKVSGFLEYCFLFESINSVCWANSNGIMYHNPANKLQLEIESTIREWKTDEVPVGALIRPKEATNCIGMIIGKTRDSVYINIGSASCSGFSLRYMLSKYECSLDLFKPDSEKVWKLCGIEE